jgi:hypothetical protein
MVDRINFDDSKIYNSSMLVVIRITCGQRRPFVYVCYAASKKGVALTGNEFPGLVAKMPRQAPTR